MHRNAIVIVGLLLALLAGFAGTGLALRWARLQPAPAPILTDGQDALPAARQVTSAPIAENTRVVAVLPEHHAAPKLGASGTNNAVAVNGSGVADMAVTSESVTQGPTVRVAERADNSEVGQPRRDPSLKGKPRLAVVPFAHLGPITEANAGESLAGIMVSEIDAKRYDVVERSRLSELLREQRFAMTDLVDHGKGAKFGKLAAVRYLVTGELSRLGNRYFLTARVVDCQEGLVQSHGGTVKFATLTDADKAMLELVNVLGLARSGSKIADVTPPGTGNELMDRVNPDAAFRVKIRPAQDKKVWTEGENIRLVVEADRDCFVTIVTRDSAGQHTLLMPNGWARRQFVQKGQKVTIPADDAEYHFPVQPPHGDTLVRVIASLSKPLELKGVDDAKLRDEKIVGGGTKGFGVAPKQPATSGAAPADAALTDALPAGEWATDEFTVVTEARAKSTQPAKPAADPN